MRGYGRGYGQGNIGKTRKRTWKRIRSRGKSHRGETSVAREQEHSSKGWQEHPQGYKVKGKRKNKSKLAWNMI